ncbi:hypothetical protein A0J61_02657, partial [Choanephora cucurbitarum]
MTSYRKVAMILDLMLDSSNIDMIGGETICKAGKIVAKNHENIYGNTVVPRFRERNLRNNFDLGDGPERAKGTVLVPSTPFPKSGNDCTILINRGFGPRINLLLSFRSIELCTNEWKRRKTALEQVIIQQPNNLRMNKATSSKFHELPLSERDAKHLYTMRMGWVTNRYMSYIGPRGYTFAIADIYVTVYLKHLLIPEYLFQLPEFLKTLDALYSWSCHQMRLEEMVLSAAITKEGNELFPNFNADNTDDEVGSPNVYITSSETKGQFEASTI